MAMKAHWATSSPWSAPSTLHRDRRKRPVTNDAKVSGGIHRPWKLPLAGDTAPRARVQGRSGAVAGGSGVREARRDVCADKGGGGQVRDGAQGGTGHGHPGPHHEGAGDAELHRGARARGRRAGSRVEGRALPP